MLCRRSFLASTLIAPVAFAQKAETPLFLPAKAVTQGPKHHWFGYYDKHPWNQSGSRLLAMENSFADRQPKAGEAITLGMVDLKNKNAFVPLDTTAAWSWQQGTMLQWLGSNPESEVIYNSIADGQAVSVLRNVDTGKTRTLPRPIYAMSNDGQHAVTLDYSRLHRLRPGYGYASVPEKYAADPAPKELGVWHMDVATGKNKLIISLAQLAEFQPPASFKGAEHWVNHLQFNPGSTRFVFLHRWKRAGTGWTTRMLTAKRDGSDLKILHDSGMISHFDWRDDDTMLAWVRLKANDPALSFALLHVDGQPPEPVFKTETRDGHCSYSPDRKWVLNDTYPDKARMQSLMVLNVATGRRHDINQFHSPKHYTGPFRCDLHPRWNRDGTKICFDGCHDAQRQVYVVDVSEIVKG